MARVVATLLFVAACTNGADTAGSTDPGKADGDSCMPGSAGTLDSCFGFVKGPAMSQTLYVGSTVQTDDKILVYGNGHDGTRYTPFVTRYLADGKVDPAFTAQLPAPQDSAYFKPAALVVKPDGHLLMTGTYGDDYYHSLYVLGLTPDGGAETARSIQIPNATGSSGGKILLASDGGYYLAGTTECEAAFTCDTKSIFVARFDAAGKLDTTYGTNGYATVTAGPHTLFKDAVITADGVDVLGMESEPIWVGGQESSFNKVVVGALDATGHARTGFATNGVLSWSASGDEYGTLAKAFRVADDGTITVAAGLLSDELLTIGSDGAVRTTKVYSDSITDRLEPHFAADGTIFAAVADFPWRRFAHYAADGTPDAAFASTDVQVPNVPDGSAMLDTEVAEVSGAWLITAHLYLANENPDDEILLFRVWK